jgi:hypothetical protein
VGPLALFYGALAVAITGLGWWSRCRDVALIGALQILSWALSNGVNLHLQGMDLVEGMIAVDFITLVFLLLLDWPRPTAWKRWIIFLILLQDLAHGAQGIWGGEATLFLYRSVINTLFSAQLAILILVVFVPGLDETCDPGPRLRRRR